MRFLSMFAWAVMLLVTGPSLALAASETVATIAPLSLLATPVEAAAFGQVDRLVVALLALVILAIVVRLVASAPKSPRPGIRRKTPPRFGVAHAVPQTPD